MERRFGANDASLTDDQTGPGIALAGERHQDVRRCLQGHQVIGSNSTPERLMFSVRPSHQFGVPDGRYFSGI